MGRLAILVASVAMLAGTTASAAGIIGPITTDPSSSVVYGADVSNPRDGTSTAGNGYIGDGGKYGRYQTQVNVSPTQVEFKSANVTTGNNVFTSSTTTVGFTFDTGQSVQSQSTVKLDSTIIAASMGFQVILQPQGGPGDCTFDQCEPVPGGRFTDFVAPSGLETLGQVGFSFDISDNGSSIYNVFGTYTLGYENGLLTTFLDDSGGASTKLNGFGLTGNGLNQIGFSWGETGLLLDLFGPTHDLKYTTTVSSYTNQECRYSAGVGHTACLVAYSGFGDPIGRAGAIEDALAVNSAIPGGAVFNIPTFDGETLTFKSVNQTGGVPEPATWAMMIMGFGGIGATLRRRRTAPASI